MAKEDWKQRIRDALDRSGLNMKSASLKAGRGETFVRDLLKRHRRPIAENLRGLARVLGLSVGELLEGYEDEQPATVPIMGYVGAGWHVEPEYEQMPPDGFEQIEVAFQVPDGVIGFWVRGESMEPAYSDGDVVLVRADQRYATGAYVGQKPHIVLTETGRRYLKRIMPGPGRNTFNLESFNTRTMVGVRLKWVGEFVAVVQAISRGPAQAKTQTQPPARLRVRGSGE